MLLDIGLNPPAKGRAGEWAEGLKGVIKDCRAKGIGDAASVAKAIIEYRRRFLADDTNIMAIEQ
jgi:hypothetical protein